MFGYKVHPVTIPSAVSFEQAGGGNIRLTRFTHRMVMHINKVDRFSHGASLAQDLFGRVRLFRYRVRVNGNEYGC